MNKARWGAVLLLLLALDATAEYREARLVLRAHPESAHLIADGSSLRNETVHINDKGQVALVIDKSRLLLADPGKPPQILASTPHFFRLKQLMASGEILFERVHSSLVTEGVFSLSSDRQVQPWVLPQQVSEGVNFFGRVGFTQSGLYYVSKRGGRQKTLWKRELPTEMGSAQKVLTTDTSHLFLFPPAFNAQGDLALKVLKEEGESIDLITSEGTETVVSSGSSYQGFDFGVALNQSRQVVFVGKSDGHREVVIWEKGRLQVLAREGQGLVSVIDHFTPVINDLGLVAFRGLDFQKRPALFVWDGEGLRVVARWGDTIAVDWGVAELGQHRTDYPLFTGGLSLNNNSELAFAAGVHPEGKPMIEGGTAVFVMSLKK